jgi:hypothetical protein
MKEIRIGDTVEQAIERADYPLDRVRHILRDETVAVLGYGYWQSHFGGARDVIGRPMRIGRSDYTIIGVTPPGFSGISLRSIAAFIPLTAGGADIFAEFGVEDRWRRDYRVGWLQTLVKAAVVGLAVLVAFRPRRRDYVTVAALGAAVLIGMELTIDHWFYLYIPWFLPFLLIALMANGTVPLRGDGQEDLVDPASEPVVPDLDRDAHDPDVLVSPIEANRHLRLEGA